MRRRHSQSVISTKEGSLHFIVCTCCGVDQQNNNCQNKIFLEFAGIQCAVAAELPLLLYPRGAGAVPEGRSSLGRAGSMGESARRRVGSAIPDSDLSPGFEAEDDDDELDEAAVSVSLYSWVIPPESWVSGEGKKNVTNLYGMSDLWMFVLL
ncbi:hypothetical protein NPIL_637041 [Nephila pilipes]|uniref:Uncharacterized protein n=1 Tax=Nephila pilipes TaxID=299642 RepID=A0A8X6IV28_NEPPI|nr:hypothetical protein NPIL_637041 [Nephila pilipes]